MSSDRESFFRSVGKTLADVVVPGRMPERKTVPPDLTGARFRPGGAPDAARHKADEVRGYTSQVTVTDVSQIVLPADPNRKFIFLQNNDALGYCVISFGVDATLATGMKLGANGGGILLDNNVPTAAIYAIGSIAANSNITLISG